MKKRSKNEECRYKMYRLNYEKENCLLIKVLLSMCFNIQEEYEKNMFLI